MLAQVLSIAFQGLSIATGVIFCFGYAFLAGYYGRFNLDVAILDYPLWDFLLAGVSGLFMFVLQGAILLGKAAMSHKIVASLGFFLFLALGTVRYKFWFRRLTAKLPWKSTPQRPETSGWSKVVGNLYVTTCASFIFCFCVCAFLFVTGNSEADRIVKKPNATIELFFKPGEEKALPQDLLKANTSRNLIPIAQSKDLVVVCVRNELPPRPYLIGRGNLQAVKLTPEPQSEKAGKARG